MRLGGLKFQFEGLNMFAIEALNSPVLPGWKSRNYFNFIKLDMPFYYNQNLKDAESSCKMLTSQYEISHENDIIYKRQPLNS